MGKGRTGERTDLRIMRELMPGGMEKQMLMSTATSSGMRCVSVYCCGGVLGGKERTISMHGHQSINQSINQSMYVGRSINIHLK